MVSSDSEDFESADEGHSNVDKKERKKRLSSSNYSDSPINNHQSLSKTPELDTSAEKPAVKKESEGWDDFDLDENESVNTTELPTEITQLTKDLEISSSKTENINKTAKSQDTGWDDFEDWGDSGNAQKELKETSEKQQIQPEPNIKAVTEKLAAASTGSGWGWGWSVDSLLSTATAGITNITSHVSQGISTVLESGIGAPDPEELARQSASQSQKTATAKEAQPTPTAPEDAVEKKSENPSSEELKGSGGDAAFPFGNLLSGVTKFVETTGTKVLAGGLDTLETIGKKTMEVLQDGDPGLAKKRAMLGLDSGDKPILSQVLREAKEKADVEDRVKDERREAKEVHYETLFDDFEGLVHLEALEMLSRQISMRIDERIRTATPEKKQDIKETLQQVSELCEMPEEDDDDEEDSSPGDDKAEAFHERLQTATQDLGLKLQFQPLVKQYTEILEWLATTTELTEKAIYKRCVSALAETTALSVQTYHKAGELLLTKPRRSTADEADALTQMTVVLTKHISELATLFTEKLNTVPSENKQQINSYITNIFLEAGNSSTYIQNAFQLAIPILQIGAV